MLVENVAEIKGVCGDWLLSDIRLQKGVQGHSQPERMVARGVPDRCGLLFNVRLISLVSPFWPLGYFLQSQPLPSFAVLPLYSRVAGVSPNGQGSVLPRIVADPSWSTISDARTDIGCCKQNMIGNVSQNGVFQPAEGA
jgi:hypothetical protein